MSREDKVRRWRAAESAAMQAERSLHLLRAIGSARAEEAERECARLRGEAERLFDELGADDGCGGDERTAGLARDRSAKPVPSAAHTERRAGDRSASSTGPDSPAANGPSDRSR